MAIKIFKTKASVTKQLKAMGIKPINDPVIIIEINPRYEDIEYYEKIKQEVNASAGLARPIKDRVINTVIDWGKDVVAERDYLIRFYKNACGSSWTKKKNWNSSSALSEWEGVKTKRVFSRIGKAVIVSNRVKSLVLDFNNIHGNVGHNQAGILPDDIDKLSYLETLNLNHNALEGPLPSKLGTLKGLKTLQLEYNQITGQLPSLSGLTSLTYLALDHNRMEGEIKELVKLTKLKTCHIYHNKFYGKVPDELDRKELETFKFYRNYLQMSDRIKNRIAKDYPKWQGKEDSERPAHLVFD